jgi:hypothetical protein
LKTNTTFDDVQMTQKRFYGYPYSKTKMDVAGLIFEPHASNFENQYHF